MKEVTLGEKKETIVVMPNKLEAGTSYLGEYKGSFEGINKKKQAFTSHYLLVDDQLHRIFGTSYLNALMKSPDIKEGSTLKVTFKGKDMERENTPYDWTVEVE